MRYVICLLSVLAAAASFADESYESRRKAMVDRDIEARGVQDPATLKAMRTVRRHEFVPSDRKDQAYRDGPLPIGYGQTISQPYIVAYMTELLGLQPHHRVLEIGTGSGYQAAVLAEMVKEVYSVEIIPELAKSATERLERLGYQNVEVKQADGFHGWKEKGPFDAIVVTAAASFIPPPLIQQLKEGGRMAIPVGSPYGVQRLILVTTEGDQYQTKNLFPVRFVPFTRSNE